MLQYDEKKNQIAQKRAQLIESYPSLWDHLITGWNSPSPYDRGWLMYSANYLFCTHGVRWAIDPLTLNRRLPQAPAPDVSRDLQGLDFILLTHRHADHLDLDLLRSLRRLPIRWVVPEDILFEVKKEAGIPTDRILVPEPLQPIELHGIRITPFDGLHWQEAPDYPDGRRGVPAMGYLIEQGTNRWLFPGDTRKYDPFGLPDFGPVDILFAHLWLGRGAALIRHPSLLDDFCRFCLALHPRRIIVTHFEEWGRDVPDFWDSEHAKQLILVHKIQAPLIPIEVAYTGDEVLL